MRVAPPLHIRKGWGQAPASEACLVPATYSSSSPLLQTAYNVVSDGLLWVRNTDDTSVPGCSGDCAYNLGSSQKFKDPLDNSDWMYVADGWACAVFSNGEYNVGEQDSCGGGWGGGGVERWNPDANTYFQNRSWCMPKTVYCLL